MNMAPPLSIHFHGALLRTYLQDPLVSANKIDQHAAFVNPQREWFLGVDVLAGKAGVDTGQHALKRWVATMTASMSWRSRSWRWSW